MLARRSVRGVTRICLVSVVLFMVAMLAACSTASGPQVKVEEVWSRPAIAMTEPTVAPAEASAEQAAGSMGEGQGMGVTGTGAVFMRLVNKGNEADRLLGGKTEVARVVEIHETVMQDDVMKMQMLPDGLEVPPKGEVVLKPGGYHVMLIGMQRDLNVGDTFTIELQFEKGGTITVEPQVRQP